MMTEKQELTGSARMEITAYIPCYNVERYLEPTVQGLLNQSHPPAELLIIDDGSTDGTAEIASKYPVRIIRHEHNKGLAAARNSAFRHARHEFVAALDADAVPACDWLERLAEAFADDHVAGVGGRLIEKFRDSPADLWRALHLGQDMGERRIEMTWPTHYRLGGFGSLMRKSAVERIGGFNERYRTNYEDVDLSLRLLRAGYKLVFEPRAAAYHMRRDTLSSVVRTAWWRNFWTHYHNGGYNNIWLKALLNFRSARALSWQHVRDRRPSLLMVDALLPWFHTYWDLLYSVSSQRLPTVLADDEASAIYLPRPLRSLRRWRSHGRQP